MLLLYKTTFDFRDDFWGLKGRLIRANIRYIYLFSVRFAVSLRLHPLFIECCGPSKVHRVFNELFKFRFIQAASLRRTTLTETARSSASFRKWINDDSLLEVVVTIMTWMMSSRLLEKGKICILKVLSHPAIITFYLNIHIPCDQNWEAVRSKFQDSLQSVTVSNVLVDMVISGELTLYHVIKIGKRLEASPR